MRCTQIDPHGRPEPRLVFAWFQLGRFHRNAGEPPVGHAGDRARHDFALKAQLFAHSHPTQTGDTDTRSVNAEQTIVDTEVLANAFLAKLRIAGLSLEKAPKRFSKLDNRSFWGAFGDLQHPGKFIALDRVQSASQGIMGRFLTCRILPLPFRQRPIICEARNAAGPQEVCGLSVVGYQFNLVADHHRLSFEARTGRGLAIPENPPTSAGRRC